MNFYKRHLGDYAKDAGHLSMLEHGAYTLLLDRYYTTESPIPACDAHRVCRARSREERAAVEAVLREFFVLDGDAWRNRRADEELAKAGHQRDVNRQVGKLGGRPKKTESGGEPETDSVIRSETESVPDRNPSQKPEARSQISDRKSSTSSSAGMPTIPCPYDEIIARYHAALPMLPKVRLKTEARQKAMRKLWGWVLSSSKPDGARRATTADEGLVWFADYFARAAENDFLTGRAGRSGEHAGWQCDLDFLLTERGMKHVIEKTRAA